MSFSKAKLKRFNEIQVTDSPYAERAGERKESIKNLMKELSRDGKTIAKDKEKREKESAASGAAAASDLESVKSGGESVFQRTRSLRLFRTPSLPKRLRFNRQHSDLTPKEKNSAAKNLFAQPAAVPVHSPIHECNKDREALEAAQVEIKNQSEVLLESVQQVEELKVQLHQATGQIDEQRVQLAERDQRIEQLVEELRGNNEGVDMLRDIAQKSCARIELLEAEIRQILRNHENEIDVLLRNNAAVELAGERANTEKKLLNEEVVVLKKELLHLHDEIRTVKCSLDAEVRQLAERDVEHKTALEENMRLLDNIEELKRQTDADMLAYVDENQKMINELEALKRHKQAVFADLTVKEELIRGLQEELASRDIDQDEMREEMRAELSTDTAIGRDYQQQISALKELHERRIKEIESAHALATSRLVETHSELVSSLQMQLDRSAEATEEKIRISEVQTEQRLKALDASVQTTIAKEKSLWLSEMDKCQKIAETEIMQCEFEKQDLKTLLDAANRLLSEKDHSIEELQTSLGNETSQLLQLRDNFEQQLSETRRECNKLMTEKYQYQLTLNNTRSTVTILMERLKKSDSDVEMLKHQLDTMTEAKLETDAKNANLDEQLQLLEQELVQYKLVLDTLRQSSSAMEREVKAKDAAYEKLINSEQETLDTVSKIGQFFNDKIDENISKYFELYTELKQKYDAREVYVLDMKALLDEFASGIELARLELDSKDAKLVELQDENKTIKLENMTYRFKCEQFERYEQECVNGGQERKDCSSDDDGLVSTAVIANIINQLESESSQQPINMGLYSDEDKITAENNMLKEKLAEKSRQIEILQDMVNNENTSASDNISAKHSSRKQIDQLKEANIQLKNKIATLQMINQEQEHSICEMKDSNERTPRKLLNMSHGNNIAIGTPKTPKTPRKYPGKENQPILAAVAHSPSVLRTRNN